MSDEGDNYNCSLLKNSSKRAAFASQFAQAIHSRRVVWKPIPATLYRGVHLHQPKAAARRSMSFFTAHETEARTYAKHPPKQVHALRLGSNKWALDLTDNTTLQVLYNCLIGAGIPAPPAGELVKGSAALDIGANTHHEDVIFPLVKDYLFAYSVCALFRRTESSTLGRSAEEFGVYREYVPDEIP